MNTSTENQRWESFHTILSNLEVPARFFFLRHGESEGNVRGKMQGRMDCPLSALGREQAGATGDWFADTEVSVDHVFTSPLSRARETAEIVCHRGGYPKPEALESVLELDTGVFTDLSFPEIKERYPSEYDDFVVGSWESVPQAETTAELTQRGLDTWRHIVETANSIGPTGGVDHNVPTTILTVTHGGMLQWILKVSFGVTLQDSTPWMPLVLASNCGVFSFQARPVRNTDRDGNHRRWYYGQWSLLNFTPAQRSSPGALARDHFHSGKEQAR